MLYNNCICDIVDRLNVMDGIIIKDQDRPIHHMGDSYKNGLKEYVGIDKYNSGPYLVGTRSTVHWGYPL